MGTAILDSPFLKGEYIPLELEDEHIFDDETNSKSLAGLATISNNNKPVQDDVYQRSGYWILKAFMDENATTHIRTIREQISTCLSGK